VVREELVSTADAALYYAKRLGRNRTCLAAESPLEEGQRLGVPIENQAAMLGTIYALAATVDAKDHYTYGHSKKVSQFSVQIAEAMGYSADAVATIRAAGLLHDIGKIGISDEVLLKPGPLSEEDWKPIHAHPNLGAAILKHVDSLRGCLAAVQHHHERYDGSGYPSGLGGENIPIDARVMAVADTYDAMTSSRPYRLKPLTSDEALEELKRGSGTQFDPKVVDAFIQINQLTPRVEPRARTNMAISRQ